MIHNIVLTAFSGRLTTACIMIKSLEGRPLYFAVVLIYLFTNDEFLVIIIIIIRVAPDIISGPDMAAGYEAGFDHIFIHLLHCLISLKNLYF